MGGIFSRGRTDEPRHTPPTAHTISSRAKAASPTPPPTPTRTNRPPPTPQEEPQLPPYVRQRSDAGRRNSGFGHVTSDNVRKMREAWGVKTDTSPQMQRRGSRGAPSPPPSPSHRRTSFTRTTPPRDPWPPRSRSPPRHTNYASPTAASRSRSAASPRRGSIGSDDTSTSSSRGTAHAARASHTDNYSPGVRPARRPSPATRTSPPHRRTSPPRHGTSSPHRRTSSPFRRTSPPRHRTSPPRQRTSPPHRRSPPPSSSRSTAASGHSPSTASPFHHKVFRRLRDASLQPDSETICFKEEPDRYKLVMDVEEYVPGEVEVLQDDKHLTVKGRVEINHGGDNSITRTFHRHFHIPHNTREEDIDSALSKDGILTVFVPKKKERLIKIEMTD